MKLTERFWSKVDRTGSCWIWLAAKDVFGYGMFRLNGKNRKAHRLAFEATHGPVPSGLELDHLCRTRSCVNPYHLEAVTHSVNVARGLSGQLKTHCKRGHEFTAETTARNGTSGKRRCRVCNYSMQTARRTHCKRGHELSVDNVKINARGQRRCRLCAETT